MSTHTALSLLNDEELLQHIENSRDPLTTTDAETELATRFADLLDEQEASRALQAVLEDFVESEPDQVRNALQLVTDFPVNRTLLDVLASFDIDDPDVLRKQLDRLSRFDQVMQDLAEPFTALQSLVTPE